MTDPWMISLWGKTLQRKNSESSTSSQTPTITEIIFKCEKIIHNRNYLKNHLLVLSFYPTWGKKSALAKSGGPRAED